MVSIIEYGNAASDALTAKFSEGYSGCRLNGMFFYCILMTNRMVSGGSDRSVGYSTV
jgi:hypothetical protein